MAVILVLVIVYIRFAGSEALMGEEEEASSPMGVAARPRAQHLRRPGGRLHADPDRGDRGVLLQQIPRAATTSPGGGFTLDHWKDPFAIEELNEAMITSLELAARRDPGRDRARDPDRDGARPLQFFGRKASNLLIVIPIATPEVVIGAALLSMFLSSFVDFISLGFTDACHRPRDVLDLVRGHRRALAADRLRPSLEEAARDLGASALHHLPHRHPAAADAGDRRPPVCSPSRSRSTTS